MEKKQKAIYDSITGMTKEELTRFLAMIAPTIACRMCPYWDVSEERCYADRDFDCTNEYAGSLIAKYLDCPVDGDGESATQNSSSRRGIAEAIFDDLEGYRANGEYSEFYVLTVDSIEKLKRKYLDCEVPKDSTAKKAVWIKAEAVEKNGDSYCSACGHFDWSDCKYCSECGSEMSREDTEVVT